MQTIIDAITQGEAWLPVLLVIGGRALIKWLQAGQPNGLLGLLQAIVTFVPSPKPKPDDGEVVVPPVPQPVIPDRPILTALVQMLPLLLELLEQENAPQGVDKDEWQAAKRVVEGVVTSKASQ